MAPITETVKGALAALRESVDEFWAVLEADGQLTADDRAEITQLVEGADDNLAEAAKIVRDNAESE